MSASTEFRIKQRSVIEFLTQNIAIGDESWVHHYDPAKKRQSMEYRHPGSPTVKKFKIFPSAKKKKKHVYHLLECKGALYMEFLTKGATVNSDRYCATSRSLKQRIRRIRLQRNTFLLHVDHARPHCSAQTQDAMTSLKFTVVPHHSLEPRFGTVRLLVVPKLKETLKGQHFSSDAEVEAAVCKWISSQPETFFIDGMKKWIE
jgi:hypothetical protein